MTLNDIMNELVNTTAATAEKRSDYEVMIPLDREGDIDEIDMYKVVRLTWDDAEKRVILEW
jgi:hypothetical protein